jgi:putative acetyltransferase
VIREERPADEPLIRQLNETAFPTSAEARLVEALRAHGALTLSLVAELDGAIVGHVAFSLVTIGSTIEAVGLGPMAVAPAHQRRGIGGQLIREGLSRLDARFPCCVVLGHPSYYPKHGFQPARDHGLHWEGGHDDAFFVRPLTARGLSGIEGLVRYRKEFDEL